MDDTTVTHSRAEIDFDHHGGDYADRWQAISDDHLARCPVAHTAAHGGYWLVSDYANVAKVARDDATFSSFHDVTEDTPYGGVTIPPAMTAQVPIELDPPEFSGYRKLLNPLFSPDASRRWEPFIADVTSACIDAVVESGTADLVLDIANPIPAILTMKLLGVPTDKWQEFAIPAHELTYLQEESPGYGEAVEGFMGIIGQLMELVAERTAEPREDLISFLLRAEIDGAPIDPDQVINICTLIIFGGVDTTTSLLANALVWLDENPDRRAELIADPKLMATATEEFLRYFAPQQMLARTATRDTDLGGQHIREGERVMMSWAAANRDPAMFTAPGEVHLDRFPNRHTTFGLGIHRCLGSTLARVQIRVILTELLTRMPDFRIDRSAARRYPSVGIANGWISLPATFTPAARAGSTITV